ncbi:MAG: nucleoside triphosphate pyrophosphatase [Lautropia sp.]|nr:nucleoside triphosphate pyrophosphatase [Lautropia sp.]
MIYLASRSPRRLELLKQIGITDVRLLLDEDETRAEALEATWTGESPTRYVERVARAKAEAAWQRLQERSRESLLVEMAAGNDAQTPAWPAAPLLAADTTVAVGGRLLGKPADAGEAQQMLSTLSGRTHRVLSSVVIIAPNGRIRQRTQVSRVRFRRLSDAEIAQYIASGEPFGKAGAYGIQGMAARFVKKIEGSYSGIMGLPLYETAALLQKSGYPALDQNHCPSPSA